MGAKINTAEKEFNQKMGQIIRAKRKQFGLSQRDIAQQLGITHQQVQKYETGKTGVSLYNLEKISKIME